MKIKVLVLFCFLFFGIGFEGFGQFPKHLRGLYIQAINADTVSLSLKEKMNILDKKCEKVWVREGYNGGFEACYTYKLIIIDTLEDGTFGGYSEFQASEVNTWIFIKSEKKQ